AAALDGAAAGNRVVLPDRLRPGRAGWRLPPLADPPPACERAQPACRLAPRRPERRRPARLDRAVPAPRAGAPLPLRAPRARPHREGPRGGPPHRALPALIRIAPRA